MIVVERHELAGGVREFKDRIQWRIQTAGQDLSVKALHNYNEAGAALDRRVHARAISGSGSIGISAILHVGVTLALLPATGVTLPFISYGRSSLFMSLLVTGVLVSVGEGRRS